jgi:hypothetical protein
MTRARAFVAAVPQRVWTAVAGLALVASLAIAAVIGAGLSVWRSAVGNSAQPPPAAIEPPGSGLVILPGGHAPQVPTHVRHNPSTQSGGPARAPFVVRPATAPVSPSVTAPSTTPVSFTPQLLVASGGGASNPAAPAPGLLTQRIEAAVASRHEAAVAYQHQAKRHEAKHAKAGHAKAGHAKAGHGHHARHAAGRHRNRGYEAQA